jgi:hypothetical protein
MEELRQILDFAAERILKPERAAQRFSNRLRRRSCTAERRRFSLNAARGSATCRSGPSCQTARAGICSAERDNHEFEPASAIRHPASGHGIHLALPRAALSRNGGGGWPRTRLGQSDARPTWHGSSRGGPRPAERSVRS